MVIQLFIFALLFIGLASWFFIRKRKVLGYTFMLLGIVVMVFVFHCQGIIYPIKCRFLNIAVFVV